MRMEIKTAGQLNPEERAQLGTLFDQAFPPDGTDTEWSNGELHVLVLEGGQIVGNVGILERAATVGGRPVRLGGIGGVSTRMEWRKRGLAAAAMNLAQDYLRDPLAVAFGLLFCEEKMLSYYGKLGWKQVEAPIWIEDQPKGRMPFKDLVMILPVCRQDWPEGEIDLKGKPW